MIDASHIPSKKAQGTAIRLEKSTLVLNILKRWPQFLIALVFLGSTGSLPLLGRDEPRYVEIGREMMQSGDWVTPHLGGFHWFEKPALLYWLVAASFSVFGVSEWSARLGAALCGVATVALVWRMARAVDFEINSSISRTCKSRIALWCAISLASSGGMLAFSHGATFDIVLTFAVTMALCGFYLAQIEEQSSTANFYLGVFWVGVGLACLAKGLVAFILTLGAVGLYAILRRERVKVGFWWGLPLSLLVAAIWYGPMFERNGAEFWNQFFVQHHFQRFTSDKFKHHQPIWFFIEILPLIALPWTPFLIAALWKIRLPLLRRDSDESRFLALGLAWTAVPILFFSLSGSKLPGYILPALPGAFLLIGWAIGQWVRTSNRARFLQVSAAFTLIFAGLFVSVGPGVKRADEESVRSLLRIADTGDLKSLPIVQYQSMQRSAQFYGFAHLLYGNDHEPVRYETMSQLANFAHYHAVLILSSSKNSFKIQQSLHGVILGNNGKTALVLVR